MFEAGAIEIETGTKVFPRNALKGKEYKCPKCDAYSILCKGEIVPPYFRHKISQKCTYYTNESLEHIEAKTLLKEILEKRESIIEINRQCKKCKNTFAYQVDPLESDTEVREEFAFPYNGFQCRADIACIQSNRKIEIVFEICNTSKTSCERRPEPWFEFNSKDILQNVTTNGVCKLNCIRTTFTDEMYSVCNNCESSKIYLNQRGAGCGKTYESIQLIRGAKFSNKKTFIYLTKMKSARDVIRNELIDQFQRDAFPQHTIQSINSNGNQYNIIIASKDGSRVVSILIGTIDSFTYAIRKRNKNYDGPNMFEQIVDDISQGNMMVSSDGEIKWAGSNPHLASDCLVIIDEGQDLEKEYIEAFDKIIDKTGIDTYIVGDKLQSIMKEKNLFTHLENSTSKRIVKSTGENIVKRFHNSQFIPFVNKICDFPNHGLPQITNICDGKCCYTHENELTPYVVDYCPSIFSETSDEIIQYVENLKNDIRDKVLKYGYLPNNFCFIFPVVNSKNRMISILFPALQDMWINLFSNPSLYTEALIANMQKQPSYWNHKIQKKENDTEYYQYVIWHSAEQTGSIDLTESENSTRILSIHSSKGTGCECVYLLGVCETVLGCFTGGIKNTLVYESLLHVGLTRQKKYLHVGIVKANDDINQRFGAIIKDNCETLNPNLKDMRKHIEVKTLSDSYSICTERNQTDLQLKSYRAKYFRDDRPKNVDWGHHVIRNSVLKANAERYILQNTPQDHLNQKIQTIVDPMRSEICYVSFKDYKNKVKALQEQIKYNIQNPTKPAKKLIIPVLVFTILTKANTDYDKFKKVIKSLCDSVIQKLQTKNFKFCPIECLVYCNLVEMIQHPYQLSVHMLDIYKIISYYNDAPCDHQEFGCKCHEYFTSTHNSLEVHANITASIVNHHVITSRIDTIMTKLLDSIPEKSLRFKVDIKKQWSEEFVLKCRIDICTEVGENGNIYCVKLSPQFNNMNYVTILAEIAFHKMILLKQEGVKNVVYYIVTLDYDEPIPVPENIDLELFSANYLKTNRNKTHDKIFQYFGHYGKNSIRDVIENIKKDDSCPPGLDLPDYIIETFEDLDKQSRKRKITPTQFEDPIWFKEQFKESLDYKVDAMFNLLI